MAVIQEITVYRGTAPTLRFTRESNGDITGWQTKFRVRTSETAPDPPLLDIDGSVFDIGSVSTPAVIDILLTKALTLALSAKKEDEGGKIYWYGLERVNAGAEDLLAKGEFVVKYDVINQR